MKSNSLLLIAAALFSFQAFADFDGAPISPDKFIRAAKIAFAEEELQGTDSIKVVFQDAAFATDTHSLIDGAVLSAMGPQIDFKAAGKFNLTYRLKLGSGQTSVALTRIRENIIEVVEPSAFFVALPMTTDEATLTKVSEQVKSDLGSDVYGVEVFPRFKRFAVDMKKPGLQALLRALNAVSKSVGSNAKVSLNFEKYRQPFTFGKIQKLPLKKSVDLDSLRDVVPGFIAAGKKFGNTQSNIPSGFAVK